PSRGGTSVRRFRRLLRAQTVAAGMSLHRSRTRASRFSPALIVGRPPPVRLGPLPIGFHSCSGGDLNPHALRHTPLKRTCLPFHHPSDGAFAWAKIAANPNLPQPEFSKSLV